MARVVDKWPKTKDGLHSTCGTTATVTILKDEKLYFAHVGDSSAVISYKSDKGFEGKKLTRDHIPGDIDEKARIESLGGRVLVSKGVQCVAWKKLSSQSNEYDYIPFLAVSRALGDIWSYDHEIGEFIVSPEPEISVIDYDPDVHRFFILASDGLWGVINAQEAVKIVSEYVEKESTYKNSARYLLNESLDMWKKRCLRADNISIIVAFVDQEFSASPNIDEFSSDADTDAVSASEDDIPPVVEPSSLKRKIDDNLCAGNQKKVRVME